MCDTKGMGKEMNGTPEEKRGEMRQVWDKEGTRRTSFS